MGGIVALILAIFDIGFLWQLLSFVGISTVSLIATRPIAKKMNTKDVIHTNADKIIQMIGIVTVKIHAGEIGEVRVNSELWRAKSLDSEDIEIGEKTGSFLGAIDLANASTNSLVKFTDNEYNVYLSTLSLKRRTIRLSSIS